MNSSLHPCPRPTESPRKIERLSEARNPIHRIVEPLLFLPSATRENSCRTTRKELFLNEVQFTTRSNTVCSHLACLLERARGQGAPCVKARRPNGFSRHLLRRPRDCCHGQRLPCPGVMFFAPSTAVREDFLRALNDGLHQSNCSTQFEKARTNYSFLRAPRFEERPSAEEWAVEAAISLSNDKERQKRFLRLMGDRRNASLGLLKRVRESGDLRYGIKEKYSNLTKRLNREYEEAVKLTRILRESRLNLFHEFNFSLPAAAAQNHYHHVRGSSHMDGGGSNCSKTNGSDNFDERNRTLEKANISNDNRL